MVMKIGRVAVIGSGVMGAGIAAHLANVGIPVLMLDLVPSELTKKEAQAGLTREDRRVRNRLVVNSKLALMKQKPSPLTSKKALSLIEIGNLEDDAGKLQEVDWIIEVVVENLAVKQEVFSLIDRHRRLGSIVSSNTSGISVEAMVTDCSDDLKAHFLGTHFFNPPRYLKLLEIIPTKHTKTKIIQFMKEFAENRLGKGVVEAKDTPNFIANRIGSYGLMITVREMLAHGLTVGEVDSITGPLIGRPKSATFRTLDLVGLDTFIHVANNMSGSKVDAEKEVFKIPAFLTKMAEQGMLGAKTGRGFYKKEKGEKGSEIFQINPETFVFEARNKLRTPAVEMAKQEKGLGAKLQVLLKMKGDKASDFLWAVLKSTLLYAAELVGEIADDIVAIDKAMKWGFGWEVGPFELWDRIGLKESVKRMKSDGEEIASFVEELLAGGNKSFYQMENGVVSYFNGEKYEQITENKKVIHLQALKDSRGVIKGNSSASLIDIGDGVALLEFTSKSNAIGLDAMQMMHSAIEEVERNYEGLVIGNQGRNFCVGANLALMLMAAQEDDFFELEMIVRQFQQMTMKIKYANSPIVVAPFNMTLGGGAEIMLPAASVQASQEAYIGLVEVGVGLIPGGGGTKELYLKILRDMPAGVNFDLLEVASSVFERVAMAKVSTSAEEARELGYMNGQDRISVNPDHLIHDAKKQVLSLAAGGYQARVSERIPVTGDAGYAAMLLGAKQLQLGGYATAHDVKIAEKLAYVLSGGRIAEGREIEEQVMLDLEREAFLSLIGEPKTQLRMQHMLLKGKPLRN